MFATETVGPSLVWKLKWAGRGIPPPPLGLPVATPLMGLGKKKPLKLSLHSAKFYGYRSCEIEDMFLFCQVTCDHIIKETRDLVSGSPSR